MKYSSVTDSGRSTAGRRKFLKLAGRGLLGVGGLRLLSSCKKAVPATGAHSEDQLKHRAVLAFERFAEVWDFNDFWKRGNTFDACLRFAAALIDRWPDDSDVHRIQEEVRKMLVQNLAFFQGFDPGGLWADDFGWWGLMALNARRHLQKLGDKELADEYLRLSIDLCWEYKKNTAYDHSPDAKPVPYGCRNGDANGQNLGVKNTVTNVLLFLLSSRLYRLALQEDLDDRDKFLDMAYRQWIWFKSWFELEEFEYLKKIGPNAGLVQERPLAIFPGSSYQDKSHPPWAEGWIWTGDQGMLVGALTDMLAVKNELAHHLVRVQVDTPFNTRLFEEELRSLIETTGHGVLGALVGNTDGIIREAPCYSSFGPAHGNDYVAGRGIMMRYLGAEEEKSLLGIDLSENVIATAEAIWETRDPATNQFSPEFTTPENDLAYIEQFRDLWGLADEQITWDIAAMNQQNRDGVCQSVGLDVFGAAIRTLD